MEGFRVPSSFTSSLLQQFPRSVPIATGVSESWFASPAMKGFSASHTDLDLGLTSRVGDMLQNKRFAKDPYLAMTGICASYTDLDLGSTGRVGDMLQNKRFAKDPSLAMTGICASYTDLDLGSTGRMGDMLYKQFAKVASLAMTGFSASYTDLNLGPTGRVGKILANTMTHILKKGRHNFSDECGDACVRYAASQIIITGDETIKDHPGGAKTSEIEVRCIHGCSITFRVNVDKRVPMVNTGWHSGPCYALLND